MVRAPRDEGPVRPVPEAGDQEHDHEVPIGGRCRAAIATERDVQVVAEPARQRHVPAPPELGDRARSVWPVEVLREADAEHEREPEGHVRVAAEVEVELDGVREHAHQRRRRVELVRRHAERGVGDRRDGVGDDDLLGEPEPEPVDARREGIERLLSLDELVADLVEANDRPGDQLREERDVEGEIKRRHKVAGRAAVDVDEIAQRVEREERDADGQEDIGPGHRREARPREARVPRRDTQVRVLEPAQERDVDDDAECQQALRGGGFAPVDPALQLRPDHVVRRDGGQQGQDEGARTPGIEAEAREHQQSVAHPTRGKVIGREDGREEEEDEGDRGEDHLMHTIGSAQASVQRLPTEAVRAPFRPDQSGRSQGRRPCRGSAAWRCRRPHRSSRRRTGGPFPGRRPLPAGRRRAPRSW